MANVAWIIQTIWLLMTSLLLLMTSHSVSGRRQRDHRQKHRLPVPQFLPTESNYTYHKGERAILYCSVKNLGTKTLVWQREEDKTLLTIGLLTYINDARYSVAHIEEATDWNLMISNVTTAETGYYECQISATDRDLRKKVYLNVKDEFSYAEPRIKVSGKLHVDRDMPLTLTCNATGATTPPNYIDWFKDGTKILANKAKEVELRKSLSINSRTITSTLTKVHAAMSDTGTYVCRTSDLQVTSVKVNVLNTDKVPKKRGEYMAPQDGAHIHEGSERESDNLVDRSGSSSSSFSTSGCRNARTSLYTVLQVSVLCVLLYVYDVMPTVTSNR